MADKPEDYLDYPLDRLLKLVKERGLKVESKATKPPLIRALVNDDKEKGRMALRREDVSSREHQNIPYHLRHDRSRSLQAANHEARIYRTRSPSVAHRRDHSIQNSDRVSNFHLAMLYSLSGLPFLKFPQQPFLYFTKQLLCAVSSVGTSVVPSPTPTGTWLSCQYKVKGRATSRADMQG